MSIIKNVSILALGLVVVAGCSNSPIPNLIGNQETCAILASRIISNLDILQAHPEADLPQIREDLARDRAEAAQLNCIILTDPPEIAIE